MNGDYNSKEHTPPIYHFLDVGFNAVANNVPLMRKYPKTSAAVIGTTVPAIGITVGECALKKVAPEFSRKHLPGLKKVAGYSLLALAAIYVLTHKDEVKEMIQGKKYPVYSKGMYSLVATTIGMLLKEDSSSECDDAEKIEYLEQKIDDLTDRLMNDGR